MELSVIIVNYNVRHFLEQCLLSVFKALDGIDGEVIVVDNNSADGSCSMVQSKFPSVKLLENYINKGFSSANNQAIEHATGRFILLLNPDTVLPEDAFSRCIDFMNTNADAGAVGLKMIDGRGKYLPESKRGLPTPTTAFFRISGLFALFPKSGYFNRYYLGNLDPECANEVDILTGAFMFIRRQALEKSGGLDESYFMYGEDIDLSYSITEAGYKNYYLPEPSIIHYKGESTRKSEINNVVHFYRSMIIFARKYFSKKSGKLFIILVRLAVIARGALSILSRAIKQTVMPVSEGIAIYLLIAFSARGWGLFRFGNPDYYPDLFTGFILPLYTATWLGGLLVWGAYKRNINPWSILKGVATGTIIILAVYGLLPLELRFSRAIILMGSVEILVLAFLLRLTLSATGILKLTGIRGKSKKVIIAAGIEEYERIIRILEKSNIRCITLGRVSPGEPDTHSYLGRIENIKEIIRINQPDEIIFSSVDISAAMIIESTRILSKFKIEKKIAQTDSDYVIGSRSPIHHGEVYTFRLSEKK